MWKFLRSDTTSFVLRLRPQDSALKTRYRTLVRKSKNEYSFGIYNNQAVKQLNLVSWNRINELQAVNSRAGQGELPG
jgi:hypothetical protein